MVQRQINWSLIDRVRTKNPIVLNLANLVTIDKVADALPLVTVYTYTLPLVSLFVKYSLPLLMSPEQLIQSPARAPWLVVSSTTVGVAESLSQAYTLSFDPSPNAAEQATMVPPRLPTEKNLNLSAVMPVHGRLPLSVPVIASFSLKFRDAA